MVCIKWITNENLLNSTGNPTQCSVWPKWERNKKTGDIGIYITDWFFWTVETNTTLQSNYTPVKINLKKQKHKNWIFGFGICKYLMAGAMRIVKRVEYKKKTPSDRDLGNAKNLGGRKKRKSQQRTLKSLWKYNQSWYTSSLFLFNYLNTASIFLILFTELLLVLSKSQLSVCFYFLFFLTLWLFC